MVARARGVVVRVRFTDPDNLTSCQSFLRHTFPGEIKRNGQALDLAFRHESLKPAAQRQVVERLLWAWRRSHRIDNDDGFILPIDQDDIELSAD